MSFNTEGHFAKNLTLKILPGIPLHEPTFKLNGAFVSGLFLFRNQANQTINL